MPGRLTRRGSLAILESLLPRWRGKALVLRQRPVLLTLLLIAASAPYS